MQPTLGVAPSEELGAEIVGGYGPNEDGYASVHFRAPDGNVYELTYDPDHEGRAGIGVGVPPGL